MTARGHLRGHPIEHDGERWVFSDTGESVMATWRDRPCGYCGQHQTPEGHDPCLGELPGVSNACCGHGRREESYVQFMDGTVVRGFWVDVPEENIHD